MENPTAILEMIRQRRRNTESEIELLRLDITRLDEAFVNLRSQPPPRPTVPADKIDSDIARLEHKRNTESMSLPAEKKILKDIEKIKSMRRAHEDVKLFNKKMDDLRAKKDTNYDRLRKLRDALTELKIAESKLIVCERLGGVVQPADLIEDSISLEGNTDKIGAIVGKGGGTMRQKEAEYGVSIDIDRKENAIKLMGTEDGVGKAKIWIDNIFAAEEHDIKITDDLLRLLIVRKGERLKHIKSEFGVRVNLNRDELSITVKGVIKSINKVKGYIANLKDMTIEVPVASQLLPKLVGKKGVALKAFEEEFEVDIQVDRENEVFKLSGDNDALENAKLGLEKLIEQHTEHEKVYELEAGMTPAIIGKGGENIQKIQSESGTYVNVVRGKDRDDGVHTDKIVVRGTNEALLKVDALMDEFLDLFRKENQVLKFSPSLTSLIVGKKGATVSKIQQENEVNIDVNRTKGEIRIRGKEENVVNAIAALKAVLDSYESTTMTGTSDELGSIIGKSGVNVKKLTEDSGANIKVDREKGTIVISGERDKVEKAVADVNVLLEKYKKENVIINVNADFIPSLIGKGGENIKKLRTKLGLAIDLGAKGSGAITLRGEEDLIVKAKETLLNLAAKYEKENVIVRIRPDAYSALIGKNGATIQGIQKETKTQIDVRREKNEVRVRGNNEENVKAAVERITEIAGESDDVISLDVALPENTNAIAVVVGKKGASAMRLQNEFHVSLNIVRDKNKVVLRGMKDDVEKAKLEVEKIVREQVRITKELIIPETTVAEIIGKNGANIKQLTSSTGAFIDVLRPDDERNTSKNNEHIVRIRGTTDAVDKAFVAIQAIAGVMEDDQMIVAPHHMELLKKQEKLKLQRIQSRMDVEITLDVESGTVHFTATDKDTHTRARAEVKALLQFFFPKEFSRVVLKPEVFAATFPKGETGAKLSELAEDSNGAMFELDRNQCVVHVMGDETQVELGLVKLKALEQEYRKRVREIKVPLSCVRVIIGKKGTNIKKLQNSTKLKFDIIRGQSTALVRMQGEPEKLQAGVDVINKIIDQFKRENFEMSYDPDAASVIIGSKGATIKRLQAESGTRIDLTDKGSGLLTIQGKPEAIEIAKKMLKETLEKAGYADDVETIDIDVHPQDIGTIIGKGGSTIREIESTSGAKVKANKDGGIVSIRGRPAEVESACSQIKAIVQKNKAERDEQIADRKRVRAEQQAANEDGNGNDASSGQNDGKDVSNEVRQTSKPAWIPGMSESDRLQAQNTNGEIMSKAALKNKQKRERKKVAAQSSKAGVESLLFMGNNNNPSSNGRDYISQVDIRGPPPGFNKSPEEDLGSATVRDALKNLGFGLDSSMDSFSSSSNSQNGKKSNSSGMQYSGLGYNLRL
eukprot:g9264.t1